ncbi:MAG: DUF692 domain-containing protein [Polyangiaceae bacterium]|nr:DUF692 domain-containing protein [Polyangiaceae bacterium]
MANLTPSGGTEKHRLPPGVGLGLRWDFLEELLEAPQLALAFLEVSPENYMQRGGYYPEVLERVGERYALVTHGLTLSLGSMREPEPSFVRALCAEVERVKSPWHSDHLSFSHTGGRMTHELLPMAFTKASLARTSERIQRLEGDLNVPIVIENITYYAAPGSGEIPEADFIGELLHRSGASLLLDVNNVFVNARNHGFEALDYLRKLPLEKVVEVHIAGHESSSWGMLVDTHGAPVVPGVSDLLTWVIERTGPLPVLLERDNKVPPLPELVREVSELEGVYQRALSMHVARRESERRARSA